MRTNATTTMASPLRRGDSLPVNAADPSLLETGDLIEEMRCLARQLKKSNRELHHHLAEKAKMQSLLFSTIQSLTVGVLAIGRDGIVITANPAACRIFDRSVEQLATCQLSDVLRGIDQAETLLRTLCDDGPAESRLEWRSAPNAKVFRHIELTAKKAVPPHDLHLAGVILAEDQTELRQLEQQANLRSRLTGMGSIAINMAHEIRNPLGSISLMATTLEKELADDESLGPLACQIVHGVQSLDHIVINSLEFAKPRRMALSRVNLAELLQDTLAYIEHPLNQKKLILEVDLTQAAEASIAGDREQLRQVMLNIYLNAIQAMDEGGQLSLHLDPYGADRWQVSVADTGSGIPPEIMDKIFDPFFTTKDKGTGVGMAVVHRILSAHNATINIQSQAHEGTTIFMTFPRLALLEKPRATHEG